MIVKSPSPPAEPNYRQHRLTSPRFMRCPATCEPSIGCPQCHFWGTVPVDSADAKCLHTYRFVGAITPTLKTYQCVKCGDLNTRDSSG